MESILSNKINALAVIVNYGIEQLSYLTIMTAELKSFTKYNVKVIVHSNVEIIDNNIDELRIFELDNYQLLPLTCRKVIWEQKDNYDVFIYGENDHLFLEYHLDNHLSYTNLLPVDRITGLIQYESDNNGRFYPGYHHEFKWDETSVERHGGKIFAHFTNVHQATFILTKEQLFRVGTKFDFTALVTETPSDLRRVCNKIMKLLGLSTYKPQLYSVKCKVNTDLFLFGGMKKLICISDFEENLIHHMPNVYISGDKGRYKLGSNSDKMLNSIQKLIS
jgi:hypothetical protein